MFPRVPADMFRFTTAPNAELHTAALQAFGEANERLETALTFDDVHRKLRDVGWFDPVTDEELTRTLKSLKEWGLIDVVQNHAAQYTTADDYERKNLNYLLTKKGEAAFEGVQHALTILASSGALQTAVLDAITDRLNELSATNDDRRTYTTLMELEGHLDALRSNTKQFNGELQRLLREDQADLQTFHDVKRATVTYLQEFVSDLDGRKHKIREAINRIDPQDVHARALRGADLPKLRDDPGPQWLKHRQTKWEGLLLWFHHTPPRVDELQDIARRAIISLLRVLDRISEQRRRPTNTAADFRALARWFAKTDTDDEAHELFNAAFGLWPARHAHLQHADGELIPSAESWHNTPPVPVSPQLRKTGKQEHIGSTGKVRDVEEIRRNRKAQAQQERIELDLAWNQLHTPGPIRISSLTELDHETFHRLLELVGRALGSKPDSTGTRTAGTSDGRVHISLRNARGWATITTQKGTFSGPDYVIEVQRR